MSWGARPGDPEAIIESYAGSGAWSVYRELDFQGRHDLIVDRTDAKTNSDDWLIAVFAWEIMVILYLIPRVP